MKRIFLFACLLAATGAGLSGCNNGDYDARPDVDLSDKINPLNPKGGIHPNFDWPQVGPMTAEINGTAWKADQAYLDTFTIKDDNNNPVRKEVIVSGLRDSKNPKINITLSLKHDQVKAGQEIDMNWLPGVSSFGYIITNVDSNQNAEDGYNYFYVSGYSATGKVKILEYDDAKHIKGYFYFIARNPEGYYINVQKGFFDITK